MLGDTLEALARDARGELLRQGLPQDRIRAIRRVHLRYDGTDSALIVNLGTVADMAAQFESAYQRRYSFLMPGRSLIAEAVSVEAIGLSDAPAEPVPLGANRAGAARPAENVDMYSGGRWQRTPVFLRVDLAPGDRIDGPAIIAEANATTVVEPGWQAEVTRLGHLVLARVVPRPARVAVGTSVDPVMLEIFNNLYMSIAEQMGLDRKSVV